MGGILCSRKEQKIRPYYTNKVDKTTGEIAESQYGDALLDKILVVLYFGKKIITRFHEWKIERVGLSISPLEFYK